MTLFFLVLYSVYALLMLWLIVGWRRAVNREFPTNGTTGISVIVAARNEAITIGWLLTSMAKLKYPKEKFELIVVDDHSTDNTFDIVQAAIQPFSNFHVIASTGQGKKSAIATGVAQAKFNVIVTTDADCQVNPRWLGHIGDQMSDQRVKLMVGPVGIEGTNFFCRLQAIEFCSLAGTAGATLGFGMPSMSNGANLVYRKDCFYEVGGYTGNETFSSGDDEFLVRKFYSRWNDGVCWLNQRDAVVTANAQQSWRAFLSQRLRWAGKWKPDFTLFSTWAAVLVWLMHVLFIASIVMALSGKPDMRVVLGAFGLKLVSELSFLYPVSKFLNVRWSWISFLLLQFTYSFYVVLVGFLSLFVKVKWKGRVVSTKAGDRR